MLKKSAFIAIAALLATAGVASAQEKKEVTNPWMQCGIGAAIFPTIPVAAAVSNIIWDLGTTAVTSQISTPESCTGSLPTAAMFINRTYAQLSAETAAGQGEHLAAVGAILGCSAAGQQKLVAHVRADMAANMARPGFSARPQTEQAEAYFNSVNDAVTGDLAGECAAG